MYLGGVVQWILERFRAEGVQFRPSLPYKHNFFSLKHLIILEKTVATIVPRKH